jgi:hypothetical protein
MGILDDAIRDHLELIRRRGATDTEVRRLEDEAFGPPTRPDEADFPESDERSNGNGVAIEEPGLEDAAAHEDVTTLLPAEDAGEPEALSPGTGLEEPTGAHVTADVDELEDEPVLGEPTPEPAGEVIQEEPFAEEHPIVEEPPDTGEQAIEAEEVPSEEQLEPEGATPLEPPIESLETVEHPFPDEITESEEPGEEAPPPDDYTAGDDEPPEGEVEGEPESSEEDVLADTPDFLKDQPEDDELWFEQGQPKDFDF